MRTDKNIKIVLLGSTGEGKSSFGNYILKNNDKNFEESNNPESCTATISCCRGKEKTEVQNLYIIDTPGINDSEGRDNIFIKKITKELRDNYTNDINAFLFFFNINKLRLSFDMKKELYYFCLMFPIKDFWSHVGIVFTFAFECFPDEKIENLKKNKRNNFIADFIETINSYIKEINDLNDYEIKPPENLNVFFTDCGEVYPPYTHKRTEIEIKKIIEWASNLSKLDLSLANINVNINYKYYKQIHDYIKEEKIHINSEKFKIIKQYTKQYKTIDFQNRQKIISDPKFYKEEIKFFKLYKDKIIISNDKRIYDDNHFLVEKKYKYFQRWDEVDRYDNIIHYGNEENIHYSNDSDIISRNWRIYNTSYKTEYDHVIRYDYDIEYEKMWILFVPVQLKYKKPYKLIQNLYYKKEDKIDDLGYKKYGDWFVNEYGATRKDFYTPRYRI